MKIDKTLTIGALYDDGNRSYWKAIKKYFPNINVISVGINDLNEPDYKKIDLSVFNTKLIEQLKELPTPNIILASPPCESWSNADTIKTYQPNSLILNNYNFFLEQNQKFYANRRKHMYRNFFNKQRTRLYGEATQLGLNLILRTFNPKIGIIENPATSRCGLYQQDYLNWGGIMNKTYYNNYGFDYTKPTIFKSNIALNLKQEKIKQTTKGEKVCGYDNRSAIPELLIKDIIDKCLEVK